MATPMPYSIRLTILLVILSEHTILFMIPTFLAYMMERFLKGSVPDAELNTVISYKAGQLEGFNGMMSFVGCLLWGAVSDKIGRKNGLIIVLTGMIVASLGFGLAGSYEVALFWRVFAGFCAGIVPISKALIQDITDSTNIAILYSYLGAGYGFASIIGPTIGGLFSYPGKLLPIFDNDFFNNNPYILPQILHSCIAFSALLMVIFIIPDKRKTETVVETHESPTSLLRNKNYLIAVSIFCLIAVVQFSYRITMALWVKIDVENGGLGWKSERNAGYMNSASGVIVTAYHLGIVPLLSKKLGVIKSCILLDLQLIPIVAFMSWAYQLEDFWLWAVLIICNGISIVSTTAFMSFISIAVSNSVKSEIVGTAMGISQSIIAFIRGLTIVSFGALFGATQKWGLDFPFDTHFSFFVIAFVLLLDYLIIVSFLDKSVEKRLEVRPEAVPLIDMKNKDN